nr:glucose 1-dehydrogenase [Nonomuraea rhizosphaerae]
MEEFPDPSPKPDELLVQGLALGVCGTDRELTAADLGWPSERRLVLGHESLGRVLETPPGCGFSPGDLIVGVVRRPDPVPCPACARGESDMCRNGLYTERGIKALDGFGSELWTIEAAYAVPLDARLATVGMLLEPTSIVAKAWQQIERVGARAWSEPRTVLVTGAGPIGLLAALLGRQRGLDVHVLDRAPDGVKPALVSGLGGTYHSGSTLEAVGDLRPDVIIEATGAVRLVLEAMTRTAAAGIVCLAGVSAEGITIPADMGLVNRSLVLTNTVVFGSVNSSLPHYRDAAAALARADRGWLERLITRRVPLERAFDAFEPREDDVKVVIDLNDPL